MLKRFVCIRRDKICEKCPIRINCIYKKLFEPTTENFSSIFKGVHDLPRPFILNVSDIQNESTDELKFGLTLIGDSAKNAHYFINAFIELGDKGISKEKLKYKAISVTSFNAAIYTREAELVKIPLPTQIVGEDSGIDGVISVELNFITPVRIKEKGSYYWSGSFSPLFRSLLRRITLLETLYCGASPERNIQELLTISDEVKLIEMKRRFRDQRRYSKRLDKITLHGGYLGKFVYANFNPQLISLLRIGERIHIGHNATFGMGEFKLDLLQPSLK